MKDEFYCYYDLQERHSSSEGHVLLAPSQMVKRERWVERKKPVFIVLHLVMQSDVGFDVSILA